MADTTNELDLMVVAPNNTKVLCENERVRVLEFQAKAGERIGLHEHPEMVVYVLQRGRRSFTDADGTVTLSDPDVGTAFIRTGRSVHTEEVHEDFRGLLIEFKS